MILSNFCRTIKHGSLIQPTYLSKLCFIQSINISSENMRELHSENVREIPIHTENQNTNFKTQNATTKNYTTLDNELDKFKPLAQQWWNLDGDFKPLHSMNEIRVPFISSGLTESGVATTVKDGPHPLNGLKLLDVGCGGGILTEPLARLGANIVGLDAVEEGLEVAKFHAQLDKDITDNICYVHGTIEEHVLSNYEVYDGVIISEVVEHVDNVSMFLEKCVNVSKPGGSIFITTINKTPASFVAAIALAEYVLRIVPMGTHDYEKFVPKQDLITTLGNLGCHVRLVHGMTYIPFVNKWIWIPDTSVNYAIQAVKTI